MLEGYVAAGAATNYNKDIGTRVPDSHMAMPDTADSVRKTQLSVDKAAGATPQ